MSYTMELNNERKDANFVSGKINGKSAIVEIFSAMRDGKDLAPYGKKADVAAKYIMELNEHNKKEYPPMHTAEHLLNATMEKMFGCPRSRNAHIERKKSKADYILDQQPTEEQIAAIENAVNEQIARNLDVTVEFLSDRKSVV